MISRVGYTDNRTSFGAYLKVDNNGNFYKLYNASSIDTETIKFAEDLSNKAQNHELEIIRLTEGTAPSMLVRNNATGSIAEFRAQTFHSLLKTSLKELNNMAKNKVAFWNENTKPAKLYRILTGQTKNNIPKI